MASAKPATVPVGSALGRSLTREGGAAGAEAEREVARVAGRARGRRPCCRRCPGATTAPVVGPLAGRLARPEHLRQRRVPVHARRRRARAGRAGSRPRPATTSRCPTRRRGRWCGAPVSRAVSQSWGSSTAATRPYTSGSHRRSQRSLVMVKLATGTLPHAVGPGRGAARQRVDERLGVGRRLGVVPELRRPQHRAVARRARPARAAGRRRRWRPAGGGPGTPASAHAASNAAHQASRVLLAPRRRRRRVRRPTRGDERAGVGVAHLDLARRRRRVDADDQRHSARTPRSSSVTSWSRRSWP